MFPWNSGCILQLTRFFNSTIPWQVWVRRIQAVGTWSSAWLINSLNPSKNGSEIPRRLRQVGYKVTIPHIMTSKGHGRPWAGVPGLCIHMPAEGTPGHLMGWTSTAWAWPLSVFGAFDMVVGETSTAVCSGQSHESDPSKKKYARAVG